MIGVDPASAGPMFMLGAHPTLLPLVVLAFVSGCGIEVFSIGWQTALHEHIPNDVLSRVSSYDALGSFVAMPLGQLAFGPLSQVFDARDLMVVSAVVFVLIALATLASSSVRNLERMPDESTETRRPMVSRMGRLTRVTETPTDLPRPPSPPASRSTRTFHGDTFVDSYEWLRDKESPETVAYLEAENAYTKAMTAHLADLRGAIFDEIKGRTQETDLSVPSRSGEHWYYSRTIEG